MEAPRRPTGWDELQLHALRTTQSFTGLNDESIGALDGWFDRGPAELTPATSSLSEEARLALRAYLLIAAALGTAEHDDTYAESIATLTGPANDNADRIREERARLAG